jgi:alpha-beta hydrolase superfamily lysophospholipase
MTHDSNTERFKPLNFRLRSLSKRRSLPCLRGHRTFLPSWSRPENNETLVVTHGIAEHSECYAQTAESLVQRGWNVVAWDLRGHGRSEGKRGYVADFADYSRDLAALLKLLKSSDRIKDNFALVGHSMGGLVTLRFLVDADKKAPSPRAIVLSSPLIGIALAVPVVKDLAAKFLNRVLPTITLSNEIRYEELTRDLERLKHYDTDPLRHDKISPALYLGMLQNCEYVKARADQIKTPILLQAAGKEKIVSLPAIKEFFPQIGSADKKLIIYDESYHEIFNDLDREVVFKDLSDFLETRLR